MKPLDYRVHDTPKHIAPLMFISHHAWWCMCRRAFQRGYRAGRCGAAHAGPPYLKIPLTRDLIRYWRDGHELGLQRFRGTDRDSLAKMKAVGGVQ
jgi:ribosome modulation factor